MKTVLAILTLSLLSVNASPALACTAAALKSGGHRLIAKSYDWSFNAGMVHVNQRNVTKRALLSSPKTTGAPAVWTSKYASVTFNQYGRDFANGGMNEAGLTIEMTEMEPSGNYFPAGAPVVSQIQWTQYMLDSFATVGNVVDAARRLGIEQNLVDGHYLVCDKTECAVVEVLKDGSLKITPDGQLGTTVNGTFIPVPVLTNDHYGCSLKYLAQTYAGFGGAQPLPAATLVWDKDTGLDPCRLPTSDMPDTGWKHADSVDRFVRAAGRLQSLKLLLADPKAPPYRANPGPQVASVPAVQGMFDVLDSAHDNGNSAGQGGTRWQVVYDVTGNNVYWRTDADGVDRQGRGRLTGVPNVIHLSSLKMGDCNTFPTQVGQIPPAKLPASPGAPVRAFVDYDESYNISLATYSGGKKPINAGLDDFRKALSKSFSWMQPAEVNSMVFNIWGGYPAGFTTCGGPVTSEQISNLYLRAAMPYISRLVRDQMPATGADGPTGGANCRNSSPKKKDCFIPDGCIYNERTKYSYAVKNILGLKDFALTSLKLTGGAFSFAANLGTSSSLHGTVNPVNATCNNVLGDWPASCTNHFTAPVSMSGSGTVVSQSPSVGNVCFKNAALAAFSMPAKAIDVTCGPCTGDMVEKIANTKGLICSVISAKVNNSKADIYDRASRTVEDALKKSLPGFFPACP